MSKVSFLFFTLTMSLLNYSRFLADRYVEGICPHCGYEDARGDQCDGCSRTLDAIELIKPRCLVNKTHVVTTRTSAHMYLKLDAIQTRTEEWIKQSWKAGKWSPNAVINADGSIIDARLKKGLLATPLTRDLTWGVPVPVDVGDSFGMKGKVLCKLLPILYRVYSKEFYFLNRRLGRFGILHLLIWYRHFVSLMHP